MEAEEEEEVTEDIVGTRGSLVEGGIGWLVGINGSVREGVERELERGSSGRRAVTNEDALKRTIT